MSQYNQNPYSSPQSADLGLSPIAAAAHVDERVRFIRKTYLHLAGAVFALVMFEMIIFTFFPALVGNMARIMTGGFSWLVVLGLFVAVSYMAEKWASSDTSVATQYLGLATYTLAIGLIFMPILWFASNGYPGAITSAAVATLAVFAGLTAIVFLTKADFSFMRAALYLGGLAAMAAIVVAVFVQGDFLGRWFSWAMVVLMSGYILYHTSNILHHYRTDQHVAASLALFSSVATLFYYILMLFMSRD